MKDNTGLTGKDLGLTVVKGRMLHPKEIASFLGISERHVRNLMQTGELPVRRYPISPRHRVVASEDLNEYLAKIRAEAGAAALPAKALKKIQDEEVIAQ